MKRLLLTMLLVLVSTMAIAQSLPTPNVGGLKVDGTNQTFGVGNLTGANTYSPLQFGAIGDGNSHTAGAALGITSLSQLVNYTDKSGAHPYSWVGTYPYGNLFNLPIAVQSNSGSTTLAFSTTQTVGLQFAVKTTVSSGSTITFGGTWDITVGTSMTGTNIAAGATVSSISQTASTTTIVMSNAVTGTVSAGAMISFGAPTSNSGFVANVLDMTGLSQGMAVSGTGVPANTYVEEVNPSSLKVRFNNAITSIAGTVLSFSEPWLANVQVGWQVSGPGIPANTTVTGISGGTVTISNALTAAVTPVTPNTAGTPANHSTLITFYSPFTDAQVQNLQMDSLGLIAAEQAAEKSGGGTVSIPVGTFIMDQTLIVPVFPETNINGAGAVSIVGAGEYQTQLEPVSGTAFGPGMPIVSCGDPTGTADNNRGMYANNGSYCWGDLADLQIINPNVSYVYGARPTDGGVPIVGDGVRQGPRRNMENISVVGFNNAIWFSGDHTIWDNVVEKENFIGLYYGAPMNNLYGDLDFNHISFDGSMWAGIAIDPMQGHFDGVFIKPYFGSAPFGIYCVPGKPNVESCLVDSEIIKANAEGASCATFKDGNIQPSVSGSGASRSMYSVHWANSFFAQNASVQPQGGCTWNAYFDAYELVGVNIDQIWNNTFPVVSSAGGIFRTHYVSQLAATRGGVTLSGPGMDVLLADQATACQDIVFGGGGTASDFAYTRGPSKVRIIEPGNWTAVEVPWTQSATSAISLGALIEGYSNGNWLGGQLAGTASAGTAPVLGASLQSWTCNPNGHFPVVATRGTQVPVAVGASESLATLLKAPSTGTGIAAVASSVTDGQVVGVITQTNGGSTALEYMQTMFPTY